MRMKTYRTERSSSALYTSDREKRKAYLGSAEPIGAQEEEALGVRGVLRENRKTPKVD